MFGSPLGSFIHPKGWVRPAGSYEPCITATFGQTDADHLTPHQGVDIGTGRCGDTVVAVAAGKVSLAGYLGPALVVRVAHPQFPGYESGYAHLSSMSVAVGQVVTKGQRIGTLGMSGANACHLHWGTKLNGVEVDGWPLLDQNIAGGDDMIPIPGSNYKRLANKKSALKVIGNFRDERKNGAILQTYPAGEVIYPVAYASDGDVPTGSQSGEWFYCFLYVTNKGVMGGWFHSSLVGPLVDDVAATDCTAEVKAATDPLNARIVAIKAKVAANAADVAND